MNLAASEGALFIGTVLSLPIWGANCVQLFWYFSVYKNDPIWLKGFVLFLWGFDTANEALMVQGLWPALIGNWGDTLALEQHPLADAEIHHIWTAGFEAAFVQLYFIYRIYIFNAKKYWFFPAFLAIFSLSQIACMLPVVVRFLQSLSYFGSRSATSLWISLRACSATIDVSISAAVVYLLLQKGLPPWKRTRELVIRLILITIHTNMWTAIAAVVDLSILARNPHAFTFTIVEHTISPMYVGSLLGSLNSRKYVKGETSDVFIANTTGWSTSRSGSQPSRTPNSREVIMLSQLEDGHSNPSGHEHKSESSPSEGVHITTTWDTKTV